MKLISWNVNGLRACMTKGFMDFFNEADADIFCLQETKLQAGQIEMKLPGYEQFWNYAEKKGYSGTAIFTKQKPLSVAYGIGIEEHDHEGRVITLEYPDYYVVTVYTPNSQDGLARLDYRMKWEDDFFAYLKKLEENKPVIFCGDLNVAHKGTLIIEKAKAGGEASAIYVDTIPGVSQEYILNSLPDIVVGELAAKNENFIWNSYDNDLYQNNPEDETIGELNEKIYAAIRYMIRWNNSEGGSFSVDGTSKYGEYDVAQENQELGITIQIAEGYKLESISGGKAQVLQRPDGTWSVIVPRGGGVNLSAVLRRIIKEEMKNSRVSNPGASGSEEQTTVQKSSGYVEFQKAVRSQIKNAAPGAVLEVDGKNWMSFDRSTMEELSKRNDLTVVVRFRYLGKRWRVVVPGGYAVQTLLNQEGYSGFLYLSAVFGAVPEEA